MTKLIKRKIKNFARLLVKNYVKINSDDAQKICTSQQPILQIFKNLHASCLKKYANDTPYGIITYPAINNIFEMLLKHDVDFDEKTLEQIFEELENEIDASIPDFLRIFAGATECFKFFLYVMCLNNTRFFKAIIFVDNQKQIPRLVSLFVNKNKVALKKIEEITQKLAAIETRNSVNLHLMCYACLLTNFSNNISLWWHLQLPWLKEYVKQEERKYPKLVKPFLAAINDNADLIPKSHFEFITKEYGKWFDVCFMAFTKGIPLTTEYYTDFSPQRRIIKGFCLESIKRLIFSACCAAIISPEVVEDSKAKLAKIIDFVKERTGRSILFLTFRPDLPASCGLRANKIDGYVCDLFNAIEESITLMRYVNWHIYYNFDINSSKHIREHILKELFKPILAEIEKVCAETKELTFEFFIDTIKDHPLEKQKHLLINTIVGVKISRILDADLLDGTDCVSDTLNSFIAEATACLDANFSSLSAPNAFFLDKEITAKNVKNDTYEDVAITIYGNTHKTPLCYFYLTTCVMLEHSTILIFELFRENSFLFLEGKAANFCDNYIHSTDSTFSRLSIMVKINDALHLKIMEAIAYYELNKPELCTKIFSDSKMFFYCVLRKAFADLDNQPFFETSSDASEEMIEANELPTILSLNDMYLWSKSLDRKFFETNVLHKKTKKPICNFF